MNIQEECTSRFKNEKEYLGDIKPVNLSIPLISVSVSTYQHKNYIKKCLDGILMQVTNFSIEIIVGEDGSLDGTREICIEYAEKNTDKIRLFLRNRETSQLYDENGKYIARFNGVWNRMSARGKYIANCEGDDYWTDPHKLQKQVDFLEANGDYGLVHTDLDQYDTVRDKWIRGLWEQSKKNKISGDIYELLMISNEFGIYFCTMCFRSHFVIRNKEFDDVLAQNFMYGDVPLYLHIARQSKIGYIPESTAVRNVLNYSATQGRDFQYMLAFRKTALSIFTYFNNLRPVKTNLDLVYREHNQIELDVYFSYKRNEEFKKLYNSMNKNDKNLKSYIQRFGINNKLTHFFSRVLLKIISIFKIDL